RREAEEADRQRREDEGSGELRVQVRLQDGAADHQIASDHRSELGVGEADELVERIANVLARPGGRAGGDREDQPCRLSLHLHRVYSTIRTTGASRSLLGGTACVASCNDSATPM